MAALLPNTQDRCVVVKHTFIDFVDGSSSPCVQRFLRDRAHSDPTLYRPEEEILGEAVGEVVFELDGLSDADTVSEAHAQRPLPCYSELPSSNASLKNESRTPPPDDSQVPGSSPNGGRSWQEVAELLRENARLALENKLLRENARLASENSALQAQAYSGIGQAEAYSGIGQAEAYPSMGPAEAYPAMGQADAYAAMGQADAYAAMGQAEAPCMGMAWVEDVPTAAPMPQMQTQPLPYVPKTVAPGTWFVPLACGSAQVICAQAPAMPTNSSQSRAAAGGRSPSGQAEASEASSSRRRRRQAAKAARMEEEPETEESERTTVMLRNLPNNYTRTMLLAMLDSEGFEGLYDFIYLPMDFRTQACLGYAFVNLIDPEVVPKFWEKFEGYSNWVLPSRKVCGVTWSGPHQGREAHVDRYKNSPVMHASVPESYKPLIFESGLRVPFPPPSKTPRAPRTRNYNCTPGGNKNIWTSTA